MASHIIYGFHIGNRHTDCLATWPIQMALRVADKITFDNAICDAINHCSNGFMHIIGQDGLDIRSNPNTWFATLIIAHAWFNIALVIRFCEPVLSTLDPNLEEQIRLLPAGKTRWGRIRNLWGPILIPSIAAAACMTFVFSFTSFALVRWITLGENTSKV